MSDRAAEEVPHEPEVVEYMEPAVEEETEQGVDMGKLDGSGALEDGKKTEYLNLPKPDEPEPVWETKTADELRDWLRLHNVKGTWQKKLLQKCRDVWEDMQAIVREERNMGSGTVPDAEEDAPDFSTWSIERKRNFLRRRDVKGIWGKYVDQKCLEIWQLEKAGEKYVHTPPSLGRSKTRFPGQSVLSLTTGSFAGHGDAIPMSISAQDFKELAGAAQTCDLKRVTDLLNNWSAKNMLPEDPAAPGSMDEGLPESDLRWVSADVSDSPIRSPKAKRPSSSSTTPAAKRKKLSNGHAVVDEETGETYEDTIAALHARLAQLETQYAMVMQENQSLKEKLNTRK
jgi:hypothetical protein